MSSRQIIVAASYSGPFRSNGGRIACHVAEFGRIDLAFASDADAFTLADITSRRASLCEIERSALISSISRALDVARAVLAIDA